MNFDEDFLEEYSKIYSHYLYSERWRNEKFKWIAVKTFQKYWDVDAKNFVEMLKKSLSKTETLISSKQNFPREMIIELAGIDEEAVRSLFTHLFDETEDLFSRIEQFKSGANQLLKQHPQNAKQHFQNESTILTYLWLKYPDTYYIYRYQVTQDIIDFFNFPISLKRGDYKENINKFLLVYNTIRDYLVNNTELPYILGGLIDKSCYEDTHLNTLTIDFCYFISQNKDFLYLLLTEDSERAKVIYNPTISVDTWKKLLTDKKVFTQSSLEIMKRMLAEGGTASCKKLAITYGESSNFYNCGSHALGVRIARALKYNQVPFDTKYGLISYWEILYTGTIANSNQIGSFVWTLREELYEALQDIDLESIPLYATKHEERNYWWLVASPRFWSFDQIPLGGDDSYAIYNSKGNQRKQFANFFEVSERDPILFYESDPKGAIVGLGRITAAQDGEGVYFEKIADLDVPVEFGEFKDSTELVDFEYIKKNYQMTLAKLSKREFEFLMNLIQKKNPSIVDEIFDMPVEIEDELPVECNYPKNMILYGPPGTGKTYQTMIYAVAICEGKPIEVVADEVADNFSAVKRRYEILMHEGQIGFTTFHQSYGYEEFIEGIRPVLNSNTSEKGLQYTIADGVFKKFCKIGRDTRKVFIIDEINRGNISKIFGELITLIEEDKREGSDGELNACLPYSREMFGVPDNIYIIGTMNTADRSIALLDTALRRRFKFIEVMLNPSLLEGVIITQGNSKLTVDASRLLHVINERINLLYDREHMIGHAYFMELKENPSLDVLGNIFEFSIIPLLQEYFYNDFEKIHYILGDNEKSLPEYQFIRAINTNAPKVFKGADLYANGIDVPEIKYVIQKSAFNHIESFIELYENNNSY